VTLLEVSASLVQCFAGERDEAPGTVHSGINWELVGAVPDVPVEKEHHWRQRVAFLHVETAPRRQRRISGLLRLLDRS
jgi:hypothetical protein